jgi:mono/diheme cytochrome c family protein
MTFNKRISTSVFLLSSVVAICLCALPVLLSAQSKGWTIPPDAATEKNPLSASAEVLKEGKSQYNQHCEKCHGKKGLGDGPDVDRKDRKSKPANLAMSRNPDGVMFYKIWNGRHDPRMPAFKSEMTRQEVWEAVAYITSSLRSQPPASPPEP